MIKFVVSRPVRKISRSSYQWESERRFKTQKKKRVSLKAIWIVFGVFVVVYGWFLLLKNTLLAPENIITVVQYDSWNIATYGDPYMYKTINNQIQKENYNIARLNKNTILAKLQTRYPFLKDMVILRTSPNTVKVDLIFQEPSLIIRNYDLTFGVFRGHIFPIYSWDTLGRWVKILDMPGYLSGYSAMTGLFFRQSYVDVIEQVDLIYQGFSWLHHVEYLPGGERSIVYINGRVIYLNNLGDIATQIKNYELLKKYYPGFKQLKEIDLWSIELDKVIVKK